MLIRIFFEICSFEGSGSIQKEADQLWSLPGRELHPGSRLFREVHPQGACYRGDTPRDKEMAFRDPRQVVESGQTGLRSPAFQASNISARTPSSS